MYRTLHSVVLSLTLCGLAAAAPAAGQSSCVSKNGVAFARAVMKSKVPMLTPGHKELFDSAVAALRRGENDAAAAHFQSLAQSRFTRTSGPAVCRLVHAAVRMAVLDRDPRASTDMQALIALGEKLNATGDDAQLTDSELRKALEKGQQTLETLSTMSRLLEDTAMAVIRKMGG